MQTKACSKCKLVKSLSEFDPNKRMTLGANSYCKECRRASDKRYRQANPEVIRARKAAYQERFKEGLSRKRADMWKDSSWTKRLLWSANGSSKRRGHGAPEISEAWIENRFALQEGRCALTGVLMTLPNPGSMFQASLDRIDGAKGYTPDNVQLVCWGANAARGARPVSEALAFFQQVRGTSLHSPHVATA